MADSQTHLIEASRLCVGMHIHLDLGWMDHPFPLNSFKIRSQEQIDIIRSLGVERVRYSPGKSDAVPASIEAETLPAPDEAQACAENAEKRRHQNLLESQRASLQLCERQFSDAAQAYSQIIETTPAQPAVARATSENLIKDFLGEILGEDEACIRLLSEKTGDRSPLHSLNVSIMSLLLGKACGLDKTAMLDLGMGALLHDIGKIDLPERLRWFDDHFSSADQQTYREHVASGVELARKMGLSGNALLVIGQHHEFADGSGYPRGMDAEKLPEISRIVSLVNHYDNLCNPGNHALSVTPHEALSLMFSRWKTRFHAPTLALFIRMMGVYPPGSVVQLTDERFALVVSVNSTRPLKPMVMIHDMCVPRDEALLIDLAHESGVGIRRSLKPLHLPKAAYDYLSPRKRVCYFFERAREADGEG